jgi:hypothetical protein
MGKCDANDITSFKKLYPGDRDRFATSEGIVRQVCKEKEWGKEVMGNSKLKT